MTHTANDLSLRIMVHAAELVDTACEQHSTLTKAIYWLLYRWRSQPDAFELAIRAEAAQRIVARMDDTEYSAWRTWVSTPPLDRPSIDL